MNYRERLEENQEKTTGPQNLAEAGPIQHKNTQADGPEGEAGAHGWNDSSFMPADVRQGATEGSLWASETSILGTGEAFTPSNGMHSTGADHIDAFNSALQGLGHVKQGPSYVSELAPGAARATIADCGCNGPCTCSMSILDATSQGAGTTFRERESRRIGRQV